MLYVMVLFAAFLTLWYLVFVLSDRMEPPSSHRDTVDALEAMRRARLRRKRRRTAIRRSADPTTVGGRADGATNGGGGRAVAASVDCSVVERFCVRDRDCSLLCRRYGELTFRCDSAGICRPRRILRDDDDDAGDGGKERPKEDDRCDARKGEFAMLVGYTVLGAAMWQCVQMYRQFFEDGSRFCEGGTFDMRADLREPSYRDCRCPEGTVRAVYRYATSYESMGSTNLPHCIPKRSWKLYRASMITDDNEDDAVEEEKEKDDRGETIVATTHRAAL